MSESSFNLLQWSVIWAFFLTVLGFMFAEAFWLSKKGWTNVSRAFAFSVLSNVIGFAVGFVVIFICLVALLPLMFDNTVPNSAEAHGKAIIAVMAFGIFFTPVFLMICKRTFLAVLKIQTGSAAWLYALVSSVLILVVSLGVPSLLGYFIFR